MAVSPPPPTTSSSRLSLLQAAGLAISLVVTIFYAPFIIASKLSPSMQLPLAFLVSAVFFSMAVGSLLSAWRTGTGLVVAPAVGMAVFVSQIDKDTITVWQLLIVTMLAGIAAMLLSRAAAGQKSFSQKLVDDLPTPVKVGVRGGIGALLVTSAVEGLKEAFDKKSEIAGPAVYFFVAATFILLASEIFLRRRDASGKTTEASPWSSLVDIAVPVLFFSFLYLQGAFPFPELTSGAQLPASLSSMPLFKVDRPNVPLLLQGFSMGAFFIIILFILLTDIPGSPYDVLQKLAEKETKFQDPIRRSFFVTALMTALNPTVGLFSSVYYAENHVAVRDQDTGEGSRIGENPSVARFAAACFVVLGMIFLFVRIPTPNMEYWFLVAVSPSLFCLGVRITARALFWDFHEEIAGAATAATQAATPAPANFSFFVPVSLTIILTHLIGFELALPIGILYFGVASNIPMGEWDDKIGKKFTLIWGISLLVALVVGYVHLEASIKQRAEHRSVNCEELLKQTDLASAKTLCTRH